MPDADGGGAPNAALSAQIEELTTRWAGLIRGAALRHGLDQTDQDDVLQRVRVRLWRAIERRGGETGAVTGSYAYQAAVSAAIDIVRERRARFPGRHLPVEALDDAGGRAAAPAVSEADLVTRLNRALGALEQSRRIAVRLHLAGRHQAEIARVTGWSDAKTRNLLYRGLEDLRRILQEAP